MNKEIRHSLRDLPRQDSEHVIHHFLKTGSPIHGRVLIDSMKEELHLLLGRLDRLNDDGRGNVGHVLDGSAVVGVTPKRPAVMYHT